MKLRMVIVLCIMIGLLSYTGIKLGKVFHLPRPATWLVTFLLILVIVGSQILARTKWISHEGGLYLTIAWGGVILMGIWGTFILLSLPFDVIHWITWVGEKFGTPVNEGRRELLTRGIPSAIFGISAGISALGLKDALAGPALKEVKVPIENLPKSLDALRIAQISDLHVGSTIRKGYVEQVVNQVLESKPDMIWITGDLADGEPLALKEHLEPLRNLKAKLGTYYVTGNHEYYWGASDWIQKVTELGFIPLLNENRIVEHLGRKILVAGVTDTSSHQFDASHQSDPKKAAEGHELCDLKFLLAHRPDSCFEAESVGYHLQASGHTHAGQFFPWSLLIPLAHKYYKGLNLHKKTWVYVNAGTGYWGPPHRFQVPSEVTLFQITSADAGEKHVGS